MMDATGKGVWQAMNRLIRGPSRTLVNGSEAAPPIFAPPGHYYSPIPSADDIEEAARSLPNTRTLAGIELDEPGQRALLEELAAFYPSLPFTDSGVSGLRYRFDNESYSYADGIFLYCMLRHLKPRRLIEVGSGYTSALTLDTNERFLDNRIECTFIEPDPKLLFSLISEADRGRCRVIASRLQDVDLSVFDTLGPRDILFIDSTHVAKVNSDVNHLFFDILPRLAPGTIVHIHDVFPSLEYPVEWLRQGRAWNEQYVLRAFLQFNSRFRIRLFGSYMVERHADWFRDRMPLCLKNPGGAFWMERVS
jgi:predicted O-methyltransferase YrrM